MISPMVVLMVLVVIYRGMKRKTREQWFELVGRWKSSGLTARQFAERHGLRASTLLSWSSRFSRCGFEPQRQGESITATNCIEIIGATTAGAVGSSGGWIEVKLDDPVHIRVPEGYPPERLCELVRLLERKR